MQGTLDYWKVLDTLSTMADPETALALSSLKTLKADDLKEFKDKMLVSKASEAVSSESVMELLNEEEFDTEEAWLEYIEKPRSLDRFTLKKLSTPPDST
jgi:hypothetical protein